jgi:hypothetical protein
MFVERYLVLTESLAWTVPANRFGASFTRKTLGTMLASASLRIVSLDEVEHFSDNQKASVATPMVFGFSPEYRSVSLRNMRSPSPESSDGHQNRVQSLLSHPFRVVRTGPRETLRFVPPRSWYCAIRFRTCISSYTAGGFAPGGGACHAAYLLRGVA